VPRDQYGVFYDGDSYIVLSTYKTGDSPALKYDLHFWLGKVRASDQHN
jgi:gelsolin